MSDALVSFVVPVYNGAATIRSTVEALTGSFAPRRPVEVIVVNDGSRDRTPAVVAELAARDPRVSLRGFPDNRGKGAAVREGMRAARGTLLCFCDVDLPVPLADLERVIARLETGADVAIASRALPSSRMPRQPSLVRRLMSWGFNAVVRALFGLPYRDTQCGVKGFRSEAARELFARARIDGFAFDVELLLLAARLGYRVAEVPVHVDNPPLSTVSLGARTGEIVRDVWRIARNLRRDAYGLSRAPTAPVPRGAGRQRLSVVVITKNEEARIARCLESVRWADELVVVDGLSTDRTVEICRAYGATVIPHPFSGDFGLERNLGNDAARGDWILQLDADDTVSPKLRAQIERILREGSPCAAYKFRRKNWFLGHAMRYGGWYHYYPHLFRRGQAHFEGRVHHLLRAAGPMGTLEGALEHRPFDSLHQFVARHNRYTTIEAQEMLDEQGVLDPGVVRYHLTRRPLKLFWKTYVRKAGFREGWHGLVFSLLFAWVHVMKWAKYWERCTAATSPQAGAAPPLSRCARHLPRERGRSPSAPAPDPQPDPARLTSAGLGRRPTLSVVMMTKDEEARLASCLDRVAGWADEIVIIDDLSTDRTVELARRYTDKVFVFPSADNHDLQWNRGIERSTGEWILHIDADEVVTPQLREAIDRALADPQGHSAFEMMRKNFFLGHPMRYGGWYHRHLVLFRRDRARCVGKGIHVQLRVDGTIGFLDAEIEHYPFSSITQFIERQNHYTTVEAGLLVERQPAVGGAALAYQLAWRPMKLFWKSYRKNEGVREGWHGLVFGLLYAFVHTLQWAKYWERVAVQGAASVRPEAAEASVEGCPINA
jgi:glycosyltransferase involved in cell wall biosynthesis